MKTLLAIVAAAAAFGLASPTSAKADPGCSHGQTRVVGYTSWGAPIIAIYHVHGYDRWGHPIGHWITQAAPVRPSCPPSYGGGYPGGYSGGHHHHGSSGRYYGRPRSGVSFSFGFGR